MSTIRTSSMDILQTGQFYGQTNHTLVFDGITLTDTEYTHEWVDWHYHENAYFTFILQGRVLETNRKQTCYCPAGSLLFHHWQEPHCNRKPRGYTRGFHVEINPAWFNHYQLSTNRLQGSFQWEASQAKELMHRVVIEANLHQQEAQLATEALLIKLFTEVLAAENKLYRQPPLWVAQLREILNDAPEEPWTLTTLAHQLALHPVYLCREFPRYFHCHLGEYRRLIRLQKALPLLLTPQDGLSQIAFRCGFADQSHFNRCFKSHYGVTPFHYRKLLSR